LGKVCDEKKTKLFAGKNNGCIFAAPYKGDLNGLMRRGYLFLKHRISNGCKLVDFRIIFFREMFGG